MLFAFSEGGGSILDQLGINFKVIAVQAAIFLVTLWILWRFLFRPVTEFAKRREKEIDEAARDIEKNRGEVERLAADYKRRLDEIEQQAYDRLQQAIKEGLQAKAKIVAETEAEARKQIEAAREEIEKEKAAAREALRTEVRRLALEAAQRLAGRPFDALEYERIVDEVLSRELQ